MKLRSKILVGITLVLMFSPIWLKSIPLFEIKPLFGSYIKNEYKDLSFSSWFDGSFQEKMEEYLMLENYLSPFFIRVYNQIDYSLFDKVHMDKGILGKKNYLYGEEYVDAYYGLDKLADSTMDQFAYRFKFVKDTLEKLNIHLLYIQSPGKVSFYPEYLPDSLQKPENKTSNYYKLVEKFDKYQIEFMDFRSWFLSQKGKLEYPLFPKTGVHWSEYSHALVMDSIIDYLNTKYHYHIPNIKVDYIEEDHAKELDKDVEDVMNLLFQIDGPIYGYPKVIFPEDKPRDVKVLQVADSYLGNLYWNSFFKCFHPKSQFWFYNKKIYCDFELDQAHILQVNTIDEVLKHDMILVGATEPGIKATSWEFINNLYEYFKFGNKISEYNQYKLTKVRELVSKNYQKGNRQVEKLARNSRISYDSAFFVKTLWDIEKKRFVSGNNN